MQYRGRGTTVEVAWTHNRNVSVSYLKRTARQTRLLSLHHYEALSMMLKDCIFTIITFFVM